jgi:hypothetical protein
MSETNRETHEFLEYARVRADAIPPAEDLKVVNEILRRDLANAADQPDIQEAVIRKLNLVSADAIPPADGGKRFAVEFIDHIQGTNSAEWRCKPCKGTWASPANLLCPYCKGNELPTLPPAIPEAGESKPEDCPEDCALCSGEACDLCGAGCWSDVKDCQHDVMDRHTAGMPAATPSPDAERELDEIEARLNAATPGPFLSEDTGTQNESSWTVKRTDDLEWVGDFYREEDADFWISARADIRRLLEIARSSRPSGLDEAIAVVKKMEAENNKNYEYWKEIASDLSSLGVMKFCCWAGEDSRVIAALESLKKEGQENG